MVGVNAGIAGVGGSETMNTLIRGAMAQTAGQILDEPGLCAGEMIMSEARKDISKPSSTQPPTVTDIHKEYQLQEVSRQQEESRATPSTNTPSSISSVSTPPERLEQYERQNESASSASSASHNVVNVSSPPGSITTRTQNIADDDVGTPNSVNLLENASELRLDELILDDESLLMRD